MASATSGSGRSETGGLGEECFGEGCGRDAALYFSCPACPGPAEESDGGSGRYVVCPRCARAWRCPYCLRPAQAEDFSRMSDAPEEVASWLNDELSSARGSKGRIVSRSYSQSGGSADAFSTCGGAALSVASFLDGPCLDAAEPGAASSAGAEPEHCVYCGFERGRGWPDEEGSLYCGDCWARWKWDTPKDILDVASRCPWPRTSRYEWVCVDGRFGPQTVRALQEFLRGAGAYAAHVDGRWGPRSRGALHLFLRRSGYLDDRAQDPGRAFRRWLSDQDPEHEHIGTDASAEGELPVPAVESLQRVLNRQQESFWSGIWEPDYGTPRPVIAVEACVEVCQEGCLHVAGVIGGDPCVLCFASHRRPQGGQNPRSQLFEICQSTTYQAVMHPKHWPLFRWSALYTPGVRVFRLGRKDVEPFSIAVVSSCPLSWQDYGAGEASDGGYRADLRRKVRVVLRVCAEHGHEHLVLGAWGCGQYGTPPDDVALAFQDVLSEGGGAAWPFKRIVFAIRGDNASFQAFSGAFGPQVPM